MLMLMILALVFYLQPVHGAGTWKPLTRRTPNLSPNGNPSLMLLLSDGTVMVENDPTGGGGTNWFRLTPDSHGSYANGTWSVLAPMQYSRAGCSSDVMTNGQVFIAGGEYGTGNATSEVYDPVSNVWKQVMVPANLLDPAQLSPIWGGGTHQGFGESDSILLPTGKVLVSPVAVRYANETMIYDPVSNSFSAGPNLRVSSQSEASWVKLPDQSVLTIDPSGTTSERYLPSMNQWVADASPPINVYSGNGTAAPGEIGPALLLPNGKAIFFGATSNNLIYTPSGTSAHGTWTQAPSFSTVGTNAQGMSDAPACMMPNGKILVSTGPMASFNSTISFFEYDYLANTFTQVSGPPGNGTNAATYYTKFLQLPDGTVLWNFGSPQLYNYTPDGIPLAQGKPIINRIVPNADGSYHLTGYGLNGISAGAAYGDDAQMDSNFPLVRLANSVGQIYYARTYGWTSTGVMTSNVEVSTEFALPPSLPAGTYSLAAVANGIASDPVPFTTPLTSPIITSFNFGHGNALLNCANGLAGRTYYLLTSTNIAATQWSVIATNVLQTNGPFSIGASNIVTFDEVQRFFTVRVE
ncbi:MAG TPA: hypothetical protein VN873_14435 [Candidatus Angelobacter sp.]|nr:hypothetical protein [Candidatus Angelobacter sp.]